MKHRPYKWMLVPVVQQLEGDDVIGEAEIHDRNGNGLRPIHVYGGVQGLIQYAEQFETEVLGPLEKEDTNAS